MANISNVTKILQIITKCSALNICLTMGLYPYIINTGGTKSLINSYSSQTKLNFG